MRHVQFWKAKNDGRLVSSFRGGGCCHIPRLVDASDVRAVNALQTYILASTSALALFSESTPACARNPVDTAGIIREAMFHALLCQS